MITYIVTLGGVEGYRGTDRQDAYFAFAKRVMKANANGGTVQVREVSGQNNNNLRIVEVSY